MKHVVPEIYVRDCKNALDFYQDLFGGKVKNLQMSNELEMFSDIKNKVVHSELHVNQNCIFYFVDIFEQKRAHTGNITLMLHMDTKEEIYRIYKGLCQGGKIGMELQKTFWGELHAIVTDKFGAPWALNYANND